MVLLQNCYIIKLLLLQNCYITKLRLLQNCYSNKIATASKLLLCKTTIATKLLLHWHSDVLFLSMYMQNEQNCHHSYYRNIWKKLSGVRSTFYFSLKESGIKLCQLSILRWFVKVDRQTSGKTSSDPLDNSFQPCVSVHELLHSSQYFYYKNHHLVMNFATVAILQQQENCYRSNFVVQQICYCSNFVAVAILLFSNFFYVATLCLAIL